MLKRELKIARKSMLLWLTIIISILTLAYIVYPSIISTENGEMLDELVKALPPDMLSMFNMDISDIDSVFGWFKTEGMMLVMIIGAIFASICGGTILSKEESDKTIDYLASKPVSRSKIVSSKIIAGLVNIIVMFVLLTAFNVFGMYLSDDLELSKIIVLCITPILTMIPVFLITMLISIYLKKPKKAMSISIMFALLSYFLQAIGQMGDKFAFLKYMSVYELTPIRNIIEYNEVGVLNIILSIAISLISIILIYRRYNKKEFL